MILISATGHDRPGMVAAIAQKLQEANCNIADATMTRLSGQFAMILAVTAPDAGSTPRLEEHLQALRASHGLQIHCSDFEHDQPAGDAVENARYVLSVYGPDHTGLVAGVASVLAVNRVNITDLQTRITGGNALYVMIFELEFPPDLEMATLHTELAGVTRELGLEFSLNAMEDDAL